MDTQETNVKAQQGVTPEVSPISDSSDSRLVTPAPSSKDLMVCWLKIYELYRHGFSYRCFE